MSQPAALTSAERGGVNGRRASLHTSPEHVVEHLAKSGTPVCLTCTCQDGQDMHLSRRATLPPSQCMQAPEAQPSSTGQAKPKPMKRGFFGKAPEKPEATTSTGPGQGKARPAWVDKCSTYGSDLLKGIEKADMRKRLMACMSHKDAKANDENGGVPRICRLYARHVKSATLVSAILRERSNQPLAFVGSVCWLGEACQSEHCSTLSCLQYLRCLPAWLAALVASTVRWCQ